MKLDAAQSALLRKLRKAEEDLAHARRTSAEHDDTRLGLVVQVKELKIQFLDAIRPLVDVMGMT